jgi:hypothetical protein
MSLLPSATFSAPGVPLYGSGGGGGGGTVLNVSTINMPSAGGVISIGASALSNVNISTFSITNGGASKTIGAGTGGVVREVLSAASTVSASSKLSLVDGAGVEQVALNTNITPNGNGSIFLADSFGSFQPKGIISFVSSIASAPGGLLLADDSQAIKNSMEIGASTISFYTENLSMSNNDGSVPAYQKLTLGSNPFAIDGGASTVPLWNFSTIAGKSYQLNLNINSLSNGDNLGVSLLGVQPGSNETYFGRWDNSYLSNTVVSASPTCFFTAESSNATVFGVNTSSAASTILITTTSFGILRLD